MGTKEIKAYFRIIRKWWWVIALIFVTTVGTMFSLSFLAKKQYEASVTLQVSAPPPQEVPLYSQFGRQALADEISQTQASFSAFLQEGDTPFRTLKNLPDITMSTAELRENITVEIPDNSQLLYVRVRALEPETAALLANTLVETGLNEYGRLLAQPTANTRQFIEQELETARSELQTAEAALAQFQIDNRIGDLKSAINGQYDLIRALNLQRDLAQASGETAKAQAIDKILLQREAELQNMIGMSSSYNELLDRVERGRSNYGFLLDRQAEAKIKESQILELSSIEVITPARPPSNPVLRISNELIVLGGVASLLAGVFLAFWLEYLTTSDASRTPQQFGERSDRTAVADSPS